MEKKRILIIVGDQNYWEEEKKNPRLRILIQDEAIYKNSAVIRKNKRSHHPVPRHNHMPVGQHVKNMVFTDA